MKNSHLTLILLFAIVSGAARAETVKTLTVADFLEAGMASASGIVQADIALDSAVESNAQTKAARQFNLDAKGSLGSAYGLGSLAESATVPIEAGTTLEGSAKDVSFQVGLTQSFLSPTSGTATSLSASGTATLWDGYEGGKGEATLQKSEISVDTKRLDTSLARKTARYEIRTAYYTSVGDLRLWHLKQDAVRTSGEQRKKMEAKFSVGNATKLDVQEAQATELSAIIDEKEAAATYIASKQSLALLCGMDPEIDFEVTTELPAVDTNANQAILLSEGLTNRDDIKAYSLDLKSNAVESKLVQALTAPTVSATSDLSLTNNWTKSSSSGASISLGISIGLPVVDAGNAAARGREVEAERKLIEAKKKSAVASLRLDITQTLKTMEVLTEKITLAERMLDIAKGKVIVAQARFDEGLGSAYDLMTTISDQASAAVDLEQARINLVQASIKLENIIGR